MCQAFLAEAVGTGNKNRCVTEAKHVLRRKLKYRIYSINRLGRLLNFWTLRVGAYSRLGAY